MLTHINMYISDVLGAVFAKDILTRWLEKPVIKPLNFRIMEGCSPEALAINIQVCEYISYLTEITPKLIKSISYFMIYWCAWVSFVFNYFTL